MIRVVLADDQALIRAGFRVLVDAADFDSQPGSITWIEWDDMDGFSASTHTLPPSVFASFLINELGCEVGVLAIQARQVELDQPPSPDVLAAVLELSRGVSLLLPFVPPDTGDDIQTSYYRIYVIIY